MISVVYSILLALEILVIGAAVSHAIPFAHNSFYDRLFLRISMPGIFPKRDPLLYGVFWFSCLLIQAVMVLVFGSRLLQKDLREKISPLALAQGFWVAVEIFAAFKIYMYQGPLWAKTLFYGALVLSALHKIFWPETRRWLSKVYGAFFEARHSGSACFKGDILAIIFIISVFWITDWPKCLAAISDQDQFTFLQHFFNMTLWGKVFGLASTGPGTQIGFMVFFHLLYYIALFILLRIWLQEKFLAVFGVLMILKLQCFNGAIVSIPWAQPQMTVLTHAWDVFFFICLWYYLETSKPVFLVAMAVFCGLAIAFMPFSGICLWLAFTTAMIIKTCTLPGSVQVFPQWRFTALAVLAAPLLGWGITAVLGGHWVWPYGASPLVQQLADRHYFSFFFGFAVLALYAIAIWQRASLWTVSLAVYGLATFSQYALMAAPYGYEIYPLSCVLLFICQISSWKIKQLFYVRLGLAVVTVAALLTNSVFLLYPNIWQYIFSF
jgi:hypothetical protein